MSDGGNGASPLSSDAGSSGTDGVYSLSADTAELERCAAACIQAHELLGRVEVEPSLWKAAEAEHARTLLLHASVLEAAPASAATARSSCTRKLLDAAKRFKAAGEDAAAGDAHYRLGALECRRHLSGLPASLDKASEYFQEALALLPAESHPADHLFVRLDLVKLHRRLRTNPHTVVHDSTTALEHLLATHAAFSSFRFPLPPVVASAAGGSGGKGSDATTMTAAAASSAFAAASRGDASSRECAIVAALWPVMESELHGTLKELIKLYGQAGKPERASLFKQLYRLSLTQRELLGTGLLASIEEKWRALDAAPVTVG